MNLLWKRKAYLASVRELLRTFLAVLSMKISHVRIMSSMYLTQSSVSPGRVSRHLPTKQQLWADTAEQFQMSWFGEGTSLFLMVVCFYFLFCLPWQVFLVLARTGLISPVGRRGNRWDLEITLYHLTHFLGTGDGWGSLVEGAVSYCQGWELGCKSFISCTHFY